MESAGYFALRNNVVSDAFEALAIYRQRNMVEQDFNQLKNWLDGDRLRVGAVSVQGKLLVSTIGTALRMMMLCSAKKMENRKDKLTIPGGSLDRLLMELTLVRAEKRKKRQRLDQEYDSCLTSALFRTTAVAGTSEKVHFVEQATRSSGLKSPV